MDVRDGSAAASSLVEEVVGEADKWLDDKKGNDNRAEYGVSAADTFV